MRFWGDQKRLALDNKRRTINSTEVAVFVGSKENMMETNVGKFDCSLRVLIGLSMVVLAAMEIIGAWGWLGLMLIATGVMRFCPVYTLFGKSTEHMNKQSKHS